MGERPAAKDTGEKKDTGKKKKKKIQLDPSDFGKRNALKTRCYRQNQKGDKCTAKTRNQHMQGWQKVW